MNHFSFQEEEEAREPHSLQQELGSDYIDTWIGASQERVGEDNPNTNLVLSHFDMNALSLQQIPQAHHKQNYDCQEVCEALEDQTCPTDKQASLQNTEQPKTQTSQNSSQEAHTFYEQSNINSTVTHTTQLQEKLRDQTGRALNEFAAISQDIYSPLLLNFKKMLIDIKTYSDRTIDNLKMYLLFFQIKLEQEKERCRLLRKQKNENDCLVRNNFLLERVYMDEKVVLSQIMDHDGERLEKLAHFCEQLQESCSRLKMLLSKALEFRSKKIDHILSYIDRTERIQNDLIASISEGPAQKDSNWLEKADMRCDRYLQRKYLQEREKLFLNQLKITGEKLVALLHSIFIKEEPVISSVLDKEMSRYYKLSTSVYGSLADYSEQTRMNIKALNTELTEVLYRMIPPEWEVPSPSNDQNKVEELMNSLYVHLQNQIFLPTVTIGEDLVLFKQKARWISKSDSNPTNDKQKRLSCNGKENKLESANQPTFASLASERENKETGIKPFGMEVTVILSADKYLHLESGEKIACLKLKHLKLRRKGEKSILLNEKNRSITTLFSAPVYLGELILLSEKAAETFISSVLSVSN